MAQAFTRRHYTSFRQYWQDLSYLLARPLLIRRAMQNSLAHAFRERLMMVVTEVNQCPYCRSFHSHLALKAGVEQQELQSFAAGGISKGTPTAEIPALNYALNWAQNNAEVDHEALQILQAGYGGATATAIDLALRIIWIGNLSGNTFDYWLYRLTAGNFRQ